MSVAVSRPFRGHHATVQHHAASRHSHLIRGSVTSEMCGIFWFHMCISVFLIGVQPVVAWFAPSGSLFVSFVICCNIFCLAERFWDLQLRSLIYWPPLCQGVFLVSRLLLVTVAVVVMILWVRLGWEAALGSIAPNEF